jgi:hypothetical protein
MAAGIREVTAQSAHSKNVNHFFNYQTKATLNSLGWLFYYSQERESDYKALWVTASFTLCASRLNVYRYD